MTVSITYGSYTIPFVIDQFRETVSYRSYHMDCDFLIEGAPGSSFNNAVTTAEAALNQDSQRLQISIGGASFRDFNPTDYSGMKARGQVSKPGSRIDTEGSRKLTFSVDIELPASSAADNYRKEGTWSIRYGENRRAEVTFRGVYTGGGGNSAKDNYDAQIGTWVSSVFTALSMTESTFELIDETPEGDDEYTSISFTRVYREVIFNESSGSLNVPAIKNAVATFARSYVTEGGRSDIGATYVNITYSCLVDKTDGTYGSASAMSTLWKNVIRPHLLTQAKSLWGGTSSIIEDDNTTLDPTSRTIQSNMKILVSTKSNILEYQDVVELNRTAQRNYHKLLDGKDDTYNWHEPGRMLKATQTITVRTLSGLPVSPDILDGTFDSIDLLLDAPSGGFFNLDDENIRLEKLNKGLSPDSGGNVSSGYATVFTRMYTYLAPESKQVITGSGLRRFQRRT